MADKQHRMARASLMAALGITTFVPAAGATIMLAKDREPLVIQNEPGAAAALAQGEMPAVDISPQAVEAFFDAGYDYDHAVGLAEYWGLPTPYDAKVVKGKFLLGLIDFPAAVGLSLVDLAVDAYFDAGYDYDHALYLADYWGTATPYDAKVIKGKVLLGELDFPEAADSERAEETYEEFIDRALDAYFDAGYDYDHAEDLADFWGLDTPYEAKVYKGKFLIGAIDFPEEGAFDVYEEFEEAPGQTEQIVEEVAEEVVEESAEVVVDRTTVPPVPTKEPEEIAEKRPASAPETTTTTTRPETTTTVNAVDRALDAYLDAGYDYNQAVYLADFWGLDSPYEAKIIKGQFILGEGGFPNEGAFGPTTPTTVDVITEALNAYFDAGYDYEHAVDLAEVWGSASTPYEAKILKGKYLLGLIGFPG